MKTITYIKILLGILTLLGAWFLIPHGSKLGNENFTVKDQRIVILPSGGIPLPFLEHLKRRLELLHNTDILVSTQMGLDKKWMIQDTQQYNSNALAHHGREVCRRLGRTDGVRDKFIGAILSACPILPEVFPSIAKDATP